jgi:thiol-disulfide isomerase/thioredoxin
VTLPHRILISALALAFLAIAGWSASPPSGAWAYAGVPGPDFQLFKGAPPANDFPMKSLDGHTFNLSNLKGKVVLLNFWRSNCPYCVMEKRYLKNMVKQVARPDLEVVSVNLWDKPSWIKSSVKSPADGLRIATRPDDRQWLIENKVGGRVMGYYVLNEAREAIYEVRGFPSTYVIDKEGRVVASHLGMAKWTDQPIRKWIDDLLGKRESAKPTEKKGKELPVWLHRLMSSQGGGVSAGRLVRRTPEDPAR